MHSHEKYRALVERLEAEALRAPGRYKLKLALLAGLGYAFLAVSVLVALGVSLGLVVALIAVSPLLLLKLAKVIWIPMAFGGVVLSALWVYFPRPGGYRLRKGEAPQLQAEIERLRRAAGAPALSGVMIDNDLNAAAASIPRRMGLFGHQHYLVLGLPLMQLLDRDQFASVIAHEFGHFGGRHGQFNGWIYRVRRSWYQLLEELQRRGSSAAGVFVGFFKWYAPFFDAYSFALARRNEYDADATAARICGADATGQALIRVNLGAARLEHDFWPAVQDATRTRPHPPAALFRDMGASLRSTTENDGERLQAMLQAPAGLHDTHPSLAQRLAALGVEPAVPPPPAQSAAEALLGDLLEQMETRFSEEWSGQFGRQWQQRHREHLDAVQRLEALEAEPVVPPEHAVEHARLVELLRSEDEALRLYREAVKLDSDHPVAHFRLGVLLLARDDDAGIESLRRAAELDLEATQPVLDQLARYFDRVQAPPARVQPIMDALIADHQRRARAAHARETLTPDDRFLPHGLDAASVQAIAAVAASIPGLARVWVVRKAIPGEAQAQLVVVARWKRNVAQQNSRLTDALLATGRLGGFGVFSANDGGKITARAAKAAGKPVFRTGWF